MPKQSTFLMKTSEEPPTFTVLTSEYRIILPVARETVDWSPLAVWFALTDLVSCIQ